MCSDLLEKTGAFFVEGDRHIRLIVLAVDLHPGVGRAVEFHPGNADLWYRLGLILYSDLKEHKEAAGALQNAVRLAPHRAQVLNDAGVVLHYHLRRKTEAEKLYRKAPLFYFFDPAGEAFAKPLYGKRASSRSSSSTR